MDSGRADLDLGKELAADAYSDSTYGCDRHGELEVLIGIGSSVAIHDVSSFGQSLVDLRRVGFAPIALANHGIDPVLASRVPAGEQEFEVLPAAEANRYR